MTCTEHSRCCSVWSLGAAVRGRRRDAEGRGRAARLLGQHHGRHRGEAGLLQGGGPRHRGAVHGRRRVHADAGARGLHRHRDVERHPRRDRRVFQRRSGARHLRRRDRRRRRVLVCAHRKRHQEPEGHQRQDGGVLVARLFDQPHPAATGEGGRRQPQAGSDRRRACDLHPGDDRADRRRLVGAAVRAEGLAGEEDRDHRARQRRAKRCRRRPSASMSPMPTR